MKDKRNIEDIFRARFDVSVGEYQGWNEPHEIVWERIDSHLDEKDNRRRRKFLYFLFVVGALFFLVLFLAAELKGSKESLLLTENVCQVEAMSNVVPVSKSNQTHLHSVKSGPKVVSMFGEEEAKHGWPKSILKAPLVDRSAGDQDGDFIEKKEIEHKNNSSKFGDLQQDQMTLVAQGANTVPEHSRNSLFSRTREIGAIGIPTLNSNVKAKVKFSIPANTLRPFDFEIARTRPSLTIVFGAALSHLRASGIQDELLTELIDREYGKFGMSLDLFYSFPISQSINFSTGLGVQSHLFSTEYDLLLSYDSKHETKDGGQGHIDFEHSLPTAFGNTDTSLRLSRKRSFEMLNEADVQLDFDTQHKFVSISIPTRLSRKWGSVSSYLEVGLLLRPTYIIHVKSSILQVNSHHSEIGATRHQSHSSYDDLRRWNLTYGMDINYRFPITKNGGLQIGLNMQNMLLDYYKRGEYFTRATSFGIFCGYSHSL